jgi:hypothetical protein
LPSPSDMFQAVVPTTGSLLRLFRLRAGWSPFFLRDQKLELSPPATPRQTARQSRLQGVTTLCERRPLRIVLLFHFRARIRTQGHTSRKKRQRVTTMVFLQAGAVHGTLLQQYEKQEDSLTESLIQYEQHEEPERPIQ